MQENTINSKKYIQCLCFDGTLISKKKLEKQNFWNEIKNIQNAHNYYQPKHSNQSNLMHNICQLKSMHEKLSIKMFVHNLIGIKRTKNL